MSLKLVEKHQANDVLGAGIEAKHTFSFPLFAPNYTKMQLKSIFILFLFSCSISSLVGQSDISGTVVDSSLVSLPGANVILLRASDSLLTSFATTDNKGDFLIENVPLGSYQMHISFLGFDRNPQSLEVTAEDQFLGLGELVMYPAGYALNGVEVTAGRIPIRMKGDTMMYDAEAFSVGENANVEDLLRRMPGLSIDANGGITWRGKTVNQVLVNGKPFFAGNATLITQNMDAEALTSVEVFDQQTNREELSGVDDGEENTTLNLEMKEEFKAKVFGELEAGYGTSERYRAGAKIFRISDASQIGLLGTINNVNQVGFTYGDMSSFNQSMGRGGWARGSDGSDGTLPVTRGQSNGQNRSLAAGLNYGTNFGKTEVQLSYSLFDRQQAQIQSINQAFNRPGDIRETSSQQTAASSSYSHRIDGNLEQDLDSLSRLDFTFALFTVGNDDNSLAAIDVTDATNGDQSYTVDQNGEQQNPGGNAGLEYSRRLGKPGRLLVLESYSSYLKNNSDNGILTEGLSEELAIPGALINGLQTQDRTNTNFQLYNSVGFIEPIGKSWQLDTDISYEIDRDEADFNFIQEGRDARNQLTRSWNSLQAGSGLTYRFGDRNSLSFKMNYTSALLDLSGDQLRSTRYNYLLPRINLRLRSKKGYYSFRISSNPIAPTINQLQTIAEPGQSGRVSLGNPELEPAVRYSGRGYIWFNDQFRALSLYLNGTINYTDNAIGNELSFSRGQQIYRPINVSHAWSTNLSLGSTIGMDFINGELTAGASRNNSNGVGVVDGVNRTNIATSYSINGSINTELNENSYLTLGYDWFQNTNRFDDESTEAIKTITHNIFTRIGLEVSPKWRLEGRFTYRIYEAAAFTGAANIPDLQMSLEVRPFKIAEHFFRISAFDLFNQNTIINRQVQSFVTSETTSDALGRYFLMSFHYNL